MNSDRSLQTIHSVSVLGNTQPNSTINTVLGSVVVVMPIVFFLCVLGYRQYKTHILKRQIAMLERIFNLSHQSKRHSL
jgi:hypothetical protein